MPIEAPPEIKTLIDTLLTGFNNKNSAQFSSTFGSDVVVVDGMAPYRWTGANAQSRWFADAETWAHELGVTDEKIAIEKMVHAQVVGAHAYVSLSATLSFMLKGQPNSRDGVPAFTFVKKGEGWTSSWQGWGRWR